MLGIRRYSSSKNAGAQVVGFRDVRVKGTRSHLKIVCGGSEATNASWRRGVVGRAFYV